MATPYSAARMPLLTADVSSGLYPSQKRLREFAGERLDFSDAPETGASGTNTGRERYNTRISQQVRVRRFNVSDERSDYTMDLQLGDLLFAFMDTITVPTAAPNTSAGWHNASATPAVSLPILNYLSAVMRCLRNAKYPNGFTPNVLVQQARLVGVVTPTRENLRYTAPDGGSIEVAVDVETTRTKLANFLAPWVKPLDKIWLIAQDEPAARIERFCTTTQTRRLETVEMRSATDKKRITSVTRLVPLVTRTSYVPAARLIAALEDDDGIPLEVQSHPIFVGTVRERVPGTLELADTYTVGAAGYYGRTDSLPYANAVVDAGKKGDYGHLWVMVDPIQ